MSFVGLAIDGGYMLARRQRQQGAADLAALNGANCLTTNLVTGAAPSQCTGLPSPGTSQNQASVLANTTATAAGYDTAGTTTVTVTTTSSSVTVDITTNPPTFFLQIANIPTLPVHARAVASVASLGVGVAQAPVVGCGNFMESADGATLTDILLGNGTTTPYTIDYTTYAAPVPTAGNGTAVNYTPNFRLEGSQMSQDLGVHAHNGDCPFYNNGADWKGLLNPTSPITNLPSNVPVDNGNYDACMDADENGHGCNSSGNPNACGSSAEVAATYGAPDWNLPPSAISQCSLWIPIAGPSPTEGQANVVTFACMEIYNGPTGNPRWVGILRTPGANNPATNKPYCNYGQFSTGNGGSGITLAQLTQ